MKRIVDIESQLYARANLMNFDVYPRNIIVRGLSSARPEVFTIEFGCSFIGRRFDPQGSPEEEKAPLPGTYISPRARWLVDGRGEKRVVNRFKEWITWNWNAWLQREYNQDELTDFMRDEWGPESNEIWPPEYEDELDNHNFHTINRNSCSSEEGLYEQGGPQGHSWTSKSSNDS